MSGGISDRRTVGAEDGTMVNEGTQRLGGVEVIGERSGGAHRTAVWVGRVLSAVPVVLMTMSGVMKLLALPMVVDGFVHKYGYPPGTLPIIAALELIAVALYLIPPTAVFGAVFMTAYLGGAVATHVRASESAFVGAVIVGVCAWIGLWLREPRLRALAPLRRG